MNNCFFVGNVTTDPEQLRHTASQTPVINFRMAINRYQGSEKIAEFLDFVAWGKQAELVSNYVKKGHKLAVRTEVRTESWDDKNSGEKRYKLRFHVQEITLLTPQAAEPGAPRASAPQRQPARQTTTPHPRHNARANRPVDYPEEGDPDGQEPAFGGDQDNDIPF